MIWFPVPSNPKCTRCGSLIITNDKLAVSLDMAKLSDHNATLVLIPAIQQLDYNPSDYNINLASICQAEKKLQRV